MQADFNLFIASLLAQGMVSLGRFKDPVTGETKRDLEQARYIIDVVDMLKSKTHGNLSDDERKTIDEGLHGLRMMFMSESGKNTGDDGAGLKAQ